MSKFKDFWKSINQSGDEFYKSSALSIKEIRDIKNYIRDLQEKSVPSSKIITGIQKFMPKLSERWKAERAYWTEVKSMDTKVVGQAGEELEIDKYRVILSPNACQTCLKKTDRGRRKFDNDDVKKSGYGHVPPFHPNCYCSLIPD